MNEWDTWVNECLNIECLDHPWTGSGTSDLLKFLWASVQFSHSVMSNSFWSHGLQHARLPCPSPTPGACSNSCPLSRWCHPTISIMALSASQRSKDGYRRPKHNGIQSRLIMRQWKGALELLGGTMSPSLDQTNWDVSVSTCWAPLPPSLVTLTHGPTLEAD